ncbi:hypothetical protein VTP01DRAFT_9436 [Rhizomucor pusillus]|uniref:uncharacterized protein n=1 Tax=Rhizomucor pusillus TaxID=4840 RepID=UPI0037437379
MHFSRLALYISAAVAVLPATVNAADCSGVDILYPKEGSKIIKSEQETIYLIVGNKVENAKLEKVYISSGGSPDAKELRTVQNANEELGTITVLQEDLHRLESSESQHFKFRIVVNQDGQQCSYESPRFQIL